MFGVLPEQLLQDAVRALGSSGMGLHGTAESIPALPGTYVLFVELPQSVAAGRRWPGAILERGWYLYCGSAQGPGGLKSRVARHFRPDKMQRWHIDALTLQAQALAALVWPEENGISECMLAAKLAADGRFDMPLAGFGSSDCKSCRSHLLRWLPDD